MGLTHLVLLPKTANSIKAAYYRSIGCYGIFYKIIAKLLSAQLKMVIPFLIKQNQATFVTRCSIFHNVMIGAELLRLYNRKNISPQMLMKVDVKKAYDSVKWDFSQDLLGPYKFPQPFLE